MGLKELSLCNKIKYLNPNIFRTRCCKPLIFQNLIIWFNRIHSLKYLRSTKFGSKDIVIRKSEFVTKTQFLSLIFFAAFHAWKPKGSLDDAYSIAYMHTWSLCWFTLKGLCLCNFKWPSISADSQRYQWKIRFSNLESVSS